MLRALPRSRRQLALDGAQRFPEAVDASAVPSFKRGGQLALKPLAALRQFVSSHSASFQQFRLHASLNSIPAVMITVRRTVPLLVPTFPLAALPLTMSPLPFTLDLVPIRRPPRTLVDRHWRCLVDRRRLNVDRLGPEERMRQRRRHEHGEARKTDRDMHIGSGVRDRCGAENGADQDSGSDESLEEGALHDGSLCCGEVILRDPP